MTSSLLLPLIPAEGVGSSSGWRPGPSLPKPRIETPVMEFGASTANPTKNSPAVSHDTVVDRSFREKHYLIVFLNPRSLKTAEISTKSVSLPMVSSWPLPGVLWSQKDFFEFWARACLVDIRCGNIHLVAETGSVLAFPAGHWSVAFIPRLVVA